MEFDSSKGKSKLIFHWKFAKGPSKGNVKFPKNGDCGKLLLTGPSGRGTYQKTRLYRHSKLCPGHKM